jgi:N-acyl-L-homoserine lactone synthetase
VSHEYKDNPHALAAYVGPFRVEFAFGERGREDEFRLRYQIFVVEREWLPPDGLIDCQERDEFDAASCAFLLREADTGIPVACQRLVMPDLLPPGKLTQIEEVTEGTIREIAERPRQTWAEASRTSIIKRYRRGSSANTVPTMAVMKYASVAIALAFERNVIFSVSDPRTARLTRIFGVPLHQIGPVINFHGERAPFRMDVGEMLASTPDDMRRTIATLAAIVTRLRRGAR